MRWEYLDPPLPEDRRAKARTLAAIDRWWAAFRDHAPALDDSFRAGSGFDVPAFMHEHLRPVDPRLMWEYGPAVRGRGHRLVITAEAERTLRPMLRTLLAEAPALPGWELYPYRLADPDPDQVLAMVEARTRRRPEGLVGRASAAEGHQVDLTFACPGREDLDELRGEAFVAVETLLGEETLDVWIGSIDVVEHDGGEWLGLADLRREVERLLGDLQRALPDRPYHARVDEVAWAGLKVTPRAEATDYRFKDDLFVANTMDVDLWRAAHAARLFDSRRFTRLGETFCFLKLDGLDRGDETFSDRYALSDAVEAALAPAGLGGVIGGGTGLRYSYVDLALTDVRRAVDALRPVLRAGRVPRRSWLLFFDETLADEWIGVWDDSPPPPRESAGPAPEPRLVNRRPAAAKEPPAPRAPTRKRVPAGRRPVAKAEVTPRKARAATKEKVPAKEKAAQRKKKVPAKKKKAGQGERTAPKKKAASRRRGPRR